MSGTIERQISNEQDDFNKKELQNIIEYLATIAGEISGYYWGDIEDMSVATPQTLSSGTVIGQWKTTLENNELIIEENGASGGFGIFNMNLVSGTIKFTNPESTEIVYREDEAAYFEQIRLMSGTIERQISNEQDDLDKKELQNIIEYLAKIGTKPEVLVVSTEMIANAKQETLVLPATVRMSPDGSEVSLLTKDGNYVIPYLVDNGLWKDLIEADGEEVTFIAKVIPLNEESKIKLSLEQQLGPIKVSGLIIDAMNPISKDSRSINLDARKEELITRAI